MLVYVQTTILPLIRLQNKAVRSLKYDKIKNIYSKHIFLT